MNTNMLTPNEHKWCRAAISCGKTFSLPCFAQHAFGSSDGRTRTGAGSVLARMEKHGLARKLGRNAFGDLLFELTTKGVAAANADSSEVVVPVKRSVAKAEPEISAPAPTAPAAPMYSPYVPIPQHPSAPPYPLPPGWQWPPRGTR